LQRIFDTVALTSSQWGICLIGPIVYLAFAELEKLVYRHTSGGAAVPSPVAT
jgi:Ca2+-transporting ATPase